MSAGEALPFRQGKASANGKEKESARGVPSWGETALGYSHDNSHDYSNDNSNDYSNDNSNDYSNDDYSHDYSHDYQ